MKKAGQAAVVRPLGALAQVLTRVQNQLYQAPDVTISGMKTTDFPSPLQPVRPLGPPDAQPLGLDMQMGQNLICTPRPDSRYTAADLQALATYPLAAMCITNVKNTIGALRWKIQLRAQPGEDRKAREAKQLKDDTIFKLTDFMASPDGEHDFSDWVDPLLNDMLVLDAGNFLLRRTPDGTVYEWRVLQGAEIMRLVDANGYTPLSPDPAYGQLWNGVVRTYMTQDQLIYRPRHIVYRVGNTFSALYGKSPTEDLAEELEIGIQRLRYVKAFYKDGSIPNVLWVVPADASPDVVKAAMNYLNADMSGNLESRRMFRFAQGFRGSDSQKEEYIKQFEEPHLSDEYDDLHTRRVCFGYGTSPQRLLKMQNRSTAQTNQEAAEEEGIAPFRIWVETSINYTLQRKMGFQKYEFKFDISQDPDPTKQAELDATDLGSGIATINEKRIARGWDPRPEPEADKLGKWIATGWVGIDEEPPTPPAPAKPGLPAPKPQPDDDEPNPPKGGKRKLAKSADGAVILNPNADTIRARAAKAALFSKMWQFFHAIKSSIVIVGSQTAKMAKADQTDEETKRQIEEIVDAIMAKIPWSSLPSYVQPAIQEASTEGASIGLDQIERAEQTGPMTVSLAPKPVRVITSSVISDVNQVAMDYARNRGAEMVGMKWVDGELVQNPNAAMAITDSTRNMLREILTEAFSREVPMSELAARIQQAGVFSEERAKLIAEQEAKMAMSGGNLEAWKKTGIVKAVLWLLSSLHDDDDECDSNHDAGPVPLGQAFPSGDEVPPAHPRCRCTASIASLNEPKKTGAV